MPTYDYQCEKCLFEFEREQRITEDPIKTCPKCKSRRAKRLLSASNFILKGGGWYADGYGSTGAKKAGKSDGADSTSSADAATSSTSKKDDAKSTSSTKDSGSGSAGKSAAGKAAKSKTG